MTSVGAMIKYNLCFPAGAYSWPVCTLLSALPWWIFCRGEHFSILGKHFRYSKEKRDNRWYGGKRMSSSEEAQLSHEISTSVQAVNSTVGSVLAPNLKNIIDCLKFLKTPGK